MDPAWLYVALSVTWPGAKRTQDLTREQIVAHDFFGPDDPRRKSDVVHEIAALVERQCVLIYGPRPPKEVPSVISAHKHKEERRCAEIAECRMAVFTLLGRCRVIRAVQR